MPKASPRPVALAPRNGATIPRTKAAQQYHLRASDYPEGPMVTFDVQIGPLTPPCDHLMRNGEIQYNSDNSVSLFKLAATASASTSLPPTVMPKASPRPAALAPRNGATIPRTKAAQQYHLRARDLDAILPVSATPHGRGYRREYNVADVAALSARLRGCEVVGELSLSTDAWPAQVYCVKPGTEIPHVDLRGGYVYDRCDVEDLATSVAPAPVALAALDDSSAVPRSSPTPVLQGPSPEAVRHGPGTLQIEVDYEEDNLSSESDDDAESVFAQLCM
ncbi:hypothetical protein DFH09DRAFT_1404088 [Mycena vulgaris]|nr:hypothetical protein DFH09DRAFT_1404088 [Mycena vulgaris]